MYNRWIETDYLSHHGVPEQKWGVRNGPPYPLSRQEKFRTTGPDGRPITSKVAYKKAMKNVRAANRAERKAHPNGTPQDKEERNSTGAQLKRKYREAKRKHKEEAAAREAQIQKEEKDWKEATDRLESLNLPEDVANRLEESTYSRGHGIPGLSWGPRLGSKTQGEKLNEAIDKYLNDQKAARDAAKEHGTAEEVMKYRDSFSKDEWNDIANRLEAEARVKKLLDRPVETFNSNQNQNGGQQSKSISNDPSFSTSKLKKIAEKGTARQVYENRSKFTPEQLNYITRRLQAEETIGKFANNQVFLKTDTLLKIERAAQYANAIGNVASGVGKVYKAFGGDSGKNNNNQQNNQSNDNNQQNNSNNNNQQGGNKKNKNKNKNKGNN